MKFIIECPHCGTHQEASTGFFARKILECKCGEIIDVKKDKYTVKECPHCKNRVLYDQSKGEKFDCPVCKQKLITEQSKSRMVEFTCPSCSVQLSADKNSSTYICPLCNTEIDVQSQIKKEEIKSKGLASVIKYEGTNDVLVWKHPIEDFNLGSQLIVHESQEAIFFKDGQALDLFGAGRYTLATQKLPLLNDLYKLPVDGNPFHSEVYFINLVTQTGIKWGTDSKVRMFDPMSGLHVELGACGEFNLQVVNSRKLLIKLVGTTNELRNTDVLNSTNFFGLKVLTGKFKGLVVSKVKNVLAKVIRDNAINILEIDLYLDVLANSLKEEINKVFEEYGLYIPEFYISNVLTPDDDPNFKRLKEQFAEQYLLVRDEQIKKNVALAAQQRKILEAQTGAQIDIIQAQAQAEAYRLKAEAEAKEMQMKGYTYQQETQRMVGVEAVKQQGNNGSGMVSNLTGMVGDVVGLGVTLGAVGNVVGMTKDILNPTVGFVNNMNQSLNQTPSNNGWDCTCGQKGITSNFCPNCGTKKPTKPAGWKCNNCNLENITTNFCPNCGTKKPEEKTTWDCACGQKDITTNFCPNCGTKKGA